MAKILPIHKHVRLLSLRAIDMGPQMQNEAGLFIDTTHPKLTNCGNEVFHRGTKSRGRRNKAKRRCKHEVREQKVDERRVGGRERKRARGREVLISLDPFVD